MLATFCSSGKTFSVTGNHCLAPHFIKALKTSQGKFGVRENAFLHFQLSGIMYLFLYFMQAKNIPTDGASSRWAKAAASECA
jgi:hypothetical protein